MTTPKMARPAAPKGKMAALIQCGGEIASPIDYCLDHVLGFIFACWSTVNIMSRLGLAMAYS